MLMRTRSILMWMSCWIWIIETRDRWKLNCHQHYWKWCCDSCCGGRGVKKFFGRRCWRKRSPSVGGGNKTAAVTINLLDFESKLYTLEWPPASLTWFEGDFLAMKSKLENKRLMLMIVEEREPLASWGGKNLNCKLSQRNLQPFFQ